MKDPLQNRPTAYEVLDLRTDAREDEILSAFKRQMKARHNVRALTTARMTLLRPEERALHDLLLYDPTVLERLSPSPLGDIEVLDRGRREATARMWEAQLRRGFPDYGIAHALAVLWFWWAVYEDGLPPVKSAGSDCLEGEWGRPHARAQDRTSAGTISVLELWRRSAGYWCMLWCCDEFWKGHAKVPSAILDDIRRAMLDRLSMTFSEHAERCRNMGDLASAADYRRLKLDLDCEMRTARLLQQAGLRTGRGEICCGSILLERLGLLQAVRRQLDLAIERNLSRRSLVRARQALSPHGYISVLIETGSHADALHEIEAVQTRGDEGGVAGVAPQDGRQDESLAQMHGRALLELGRQLASLGEDMKAMSVWERALGTALPNIMREEVRRQVVEFCLARGSALGTAREDDAIALLEQGLALIDEENLRLSLANTLFQRGVRLFNRSLERVAREIDAWDDIRQSCLNAIDLLTRARVLGCTEAAEREIAARLALAQNAPSVRHGRGLVPGTGTGDGGTTFHD